MTETVQYLSGLGIAVVVSLAVVIYLRPHLRALLIELCGTAERTGFWVAFSNVALCLFPLLFAIYRWPDPYEPTLPVRELGMQVGASIGGLLAAMITMALVLGVFIPKAPAPPPQEKPVS